MRTSQNTLETISTIGIDVGKNTFHLVGLDKRGAIVLQQKVTRHQLGRRLGNLTPDCCSRRRAKSSKNSKANRSETGERSGGIGEICLVEVDEK